MNGCSFNGFLAQGGFFCQAFFGILWVFYIEKIAFSLYSSIPFAIREKKGHNPISGGYALDFTSLERTTSFQEKRAWQAQRASFLPASSPRASSPPIH